MHNDHTITMYSLPSEANTLRERGQGAASYLVLQHRVHSATYIHTYIHTYTRPTRKVSSLAANYVYYQRFYIYKLGIKDGLKDVKTLICVRSLVFPLYAAPIQLAPWDASRRVKVAEACT
jgi:hypothetical protein